MNKLTITSIIITLLIIGAIIGLKIYKNYDEGIKSYGINSRSASDINLGEYIDPIEEKPSGSDLTKTSELNIKFELIENTLTHKCIKMEINNLQNINLQKQFSLLFKESNFNLKQLNNLEIFNEQDVPYEVKDYQEICNPYSINLTLINNCTSIEKGSHIEYKKDWVRLPLNILSSKSDQLSTQETLLDLNPLEKKLFKICFNTPIVKKPDDSYGNKGTLILKLDSEEFYDKTHSSWWNTSCTYKSDIPIANNNQTLAIDKDYQIQLELDHANLVSSFGANLTGSDLHILYNNTIELNRTNLTAFNSANTKIQFLTYENISAGITDQNYTAYYSCTGLDPALNDIKASYFFYDNYQDGVIDQNLWGNYTSGTCTTTENTNYIQITTDDNNWVTLMTKKDAHRNYDVVIEITNETAGASNFWSAGGSCQFGVDIDDTLGLNTVYPSTQPSWDWIMNDSSASGVAESYNGYGSFYFIFNATLQLATAKRDLTSSNSKYYNKNIDISDQSKWYIRASFSGAGDTCHASSMNFYKHTKSHTIMHPQPTITFGSTKSQYGLDIVLVSPTDDSTSTNHTLLFTYNVTSTYGNLANNCSLFLDEDQDGNFQFNQTNSSSIDIGNYEVFMTTFGNPHYLDWKVSCYDNNTLNANSSIYTVLINNAPTTPTQYYPANNTVVSGSVTLNCSGSTDVEGDDIYYMFWGGTSNPPTTLIRNSTDTTYEWTGLSQNTYYWMCSAHDNYRYSGNTTIRRIIDLGSAITFDTSCQAGLTPSRYFDVIEESNKTYILNNSIAYDINFTIGGYGSAQAHNNISNVGNFYLCINTSLASSYNVIEGEIQYSHPDYILRRFYLDDYVLNTTLVNHTLYLLQSAISTSFLVTYQDEDYLPAEGVILDLWRYYTADGQYVSVEHAKTDENGQGVLHFVAESVKYKIYILREGLIDFVSSDFIAICQEVPCLINLQKESDINEIGIYNYSLSGNVVYTVSLNENSREVTLEYETLDSSPVTMNMNITKFDSYMNLTVCTNSSTGTGGTIMCSVPQAMMNTTYLVDIRRDGTFVTYRSFNLNPNPYEIFGETGIILTGFLFLTLVLMAVTSGIAVVIFGILGLIVASLLTLFGTGSILGVGSVIMWVIVAGLIIIFKISQRRYS